jgi:hypothetical protein
LVNLEQMLVARVENSSSAKAIEEPVPELAIYKAA